MLLFIVYPDIAPYLFFNHSNTSHVTLYRYGQFASTSFCANSNTSHVTLYPWHYLREILQTHHSNTSHVTLYRHKPVAVTGVYRLFKYISCYSLSNVFPPFPTSLYLKSPYISTFYHFLPAIFVSQPHPFYFLYFPCIFGPLSLFFQSVTW